MIRERSLRGQFGAAVLAVAFVTTAVTSQLEAKTPSTNSAKLSSYTPPEGESYFALSLRADQLPATVSEKDHVILLDTSASQFGEHRKQALAVLNAYLQNLPQNSQVALFAVDVSADALTNGSVGVSSDELKAALQKLEQRAPLGATNLPTILTTVLKSIDAQQAASILYIGDGMSTANLVQATQLEELISQLITRQIPMHSYAVGPRTDLELLGVLGLRTGGMVMFDQANNKRKEVSNNPTTAGEKLAKAAQSPVVYVQAMNVQPKIALLPNTVLPLRLDRDTVFLGQGNLKQPLQITAQGQVEGKGVTLNWSVTPNSKQQGDAYLAWLHRRAKQSEGLAVALAGEELLLEAQDTFNGHLDQLVAQGQQAIGNGQVQDAEFFVNTLQELDPKNIRAKTLTDAVNNLKQKKQVVQVALNQPEPAVQPADDDGNDQVDRILREQARVRGLMEVEVTRTIAEARANLVNDADAAITQVKEMIGRVQDVPNLDQTTRTLLVKRLDAVRLELLGKMEALERKNQQLVEALAIAEAQRRQVEELELEEKRIESLTDRVVGLMREGVRGNDNAYEEAEAVARVIVNQRPGNGTAAAALFTAEAAGQLNKAFRLRSLRADRFLETLYQVELSHVPFPDEPPIRWPSAEVWKALTDRRKKWASVDLHKSSPAEDRIREALQTTTREMFGDLTLEESILTLAEFHGITIMFDKQALLDDGTDVGDLVSVNFSGITLRSALRLILQQKDLVYYIEDEVMKITTATEMDDPANFDRYATTRVYPVGDLVIPIITPQQGGLGQGLGGAGGFNNGQNGGQFGGFNGGGGGQFGGGQFGGGGNGLFNILPGNFNRPQKLRQPKNRKVRAPKVQQIQDPEAQELIDDLHGMNEVPQGQAFAQVQDTRPDNQPFRLDNTTIQNLKKKVTDKN